MSRRPDPHRALIAALEDRYGVLEDLVSSSRRWSSATFTGARHELSFDMGNAEALIATITESDLPMAGHFVADITVVKRDGRTVTLEALTIEEL